MTLKRLFIIVFAFAFVDFLILTFHSFFFSSSPPFVLEEDWTRAFDIFVKLQFTYEISRQFMFFGLIYFLCTPKDLFSQYKKIIVVILVGTLVGGIAGFGFGSLAFALMSHRWIKEIEGSEYIDLFISSILTSLLMAAFYNLFMGFTAVSLSYIRRRKLDFKKDES